MVDKYGRKFLLSLFAMVLGAAVAVFGMMQAVREPAAADAISGMVVALSGIFAVAAGGFNLSNAYITGKQGPETKSTVTQKTEITQTGPTPPNPADVE
jgi:hypothetical protein